MSADHSSLPTLSRLLSIVTAILALGCSQPPRIDHARALSPAAAPAPRRVQAAAEGTTAACCAADAAAEAAPHLPDPATAKVRGSGKIEPTVVRKVPPPGPAPRGMVWIPPGRFSM